MNTQQYICLIFCDFESSKHECLHSVLWNFVNDAFSENQETNLPTAVCRLAVDIGIRTVIYIKTEFTDIFWI